MQLDPIRKTSWKQVSVTQAEHALLLEHLCLYKPKGPAPALRIWSIPRVSLLGTLQQQHLPSLLDEGTPTISVVQEAPHHAASSMIGPCTLDAQGGIPFPC